MKAGRPVDRGQGDREKEVGRSDDVEQPDQKPLPSRFPATANMATKARTAATRSPIAADMRTAGHARVGCALCQEHQSEVPQGVQDQDRDQDRPKI